MINNEPYIILGLCCIVSSLQKKGIKSRILQRGRYTSEIALEKAKENLKDLSLIMDYLSEKNIRSFRISSEILPRYTDETVEKYSMEGLQPLFQEIGEKARENKIRLSFHPGQFVVLSSENPKIIGSSIAEIEYHCEMLSRMGVSPSLGVCNIHVGGVYQKSSLSREEAKEKVFSIWEKNFRQLSKRAQSYLTIENDEKSYNVDDCLFLSDKCGGIPIVYDTFHEECYKKLHPEENIKPVEENLDRIVESWTRKGRLPMAHLSNQAPGARIGAHSDYISSVPYLLLEYSKRCPEGKLWVDVEAKKKEEALFDLKSKYYYMH